MIASQDMLRWRPLPDLPNPVGLAGAFTGSSDGVLFVAGGANFPDGMPWDGGTKAYHDSIYIWDGTQWHSARHKLRHKVAYGVAIPTADGLLCIGGQNNDRCLATVFRLRWDPKTKQVGLETLPSLPTPLSFAGGAAVTDGEGKNAFAYLVGGQQEPHGSPGNHCYRLQTRGLMPSAEPRWETLEPLPGPRRGLPVVAAHGTTLLVFSGRDYGPLLSADSKEITPHCDVLGLDTTTGVWTAPRPLRVGDEKEPRCVMAGSALTPPQGAEILIFGGASGKHLHHAAGLAPEAKVDFLRHHPGFSRDVLSFDPETGACEVFGRLNEPHRLPVTTTVTPLGTTMLLASGEISPGRRTARVWEVEVLLAKPQPPAFGALNWTTLLIYLFGMALVGWRCSRHVKSSADFYLAGKRIPWWAAGISIFGTQLSAITFMSIPATSFAGDWVRSIGSLMIVFTIPIVVYHYLPKFRSFQIATAYGYLEQRFDRRARHLAATLFVLLQCGRMGIVLFLPSIALAGVTGLNVYLCIALMGMLAILYTVLGGIEAVIWTDVAQVFVLIGGAGLALWIAIAETGGLEAVLAHAEATDKLRLIHPGWGLDAMTLPVMVLGFSVLSLIPYSSDQTVIQRYMTTATPALAARSLWTNFWMAIPTAVIFFGLGTALYAFYVSHPELPTPAKNDEIVPWFVIHQLPAGLAGLVIAAIFAASMSSLDSSMNSVSTVLVYDFYRLRHPDAEDAQLLRLGRFLTLGIGLVGMATALTMASLEIKFLFDAFNKILGLFGGALAGMFLLGVFTKRTGADGAIRGTLAGAVTVGGLECINFFSDSPFVHPYLFAACGLSICVLIGLLFPGSTRKETAP